MQKQDGVLIQNSNTVLVLIFTYLTLLLATLRQCTYWIRPRHCSSSSQIHCVAQHTTPTQIGHCSYSEQDSSSKQQHYIVSNNLGNQIGSPRARVHQWHMGYSVPNLLPTCGSADFRHHRLHLKGLVRAFRSGRPE